MKTSYPVVDNIKNTYIAKSPIHGQGLFAEVKFAKESVLGYLDGQRMSWDFFDSLKKLYDEQGDHLYGEWNAIDENTLLVRAIRTKYGFINHSRNPNVEIRHCPMRLVALKDIAIDEELTLDYRKEPLRKEYLDGHGKSYL